MPCLLCKCFFSSNIFLVLQEFMGNQIIFNLLFIIKEGTFPGKRVHIYKCDGYTIACFD